MREIRSDEWRNERDFRDTYEHGYDIERARDPASSIEQIVRRWAANFADIAGLPPRNRTRRRADRHTTRTKDKQGKDVLDSESDESKKPSKHNKGKGKKDVDLLDYESEESKKPKDNESKYKFERYDKSYLPPSQSPSKNLRLPSLYDGEGLRQNAMAKQIFDEKNNSSPQELESFTDCPVK